MIAEPWGLEMPPVGTRLAPHHPLRRGLVACWLYNEPGASSIRDLSGNGYHGTPDYTGNGLAWQASRGTRGPALRSVARLGNARIVIALPALSSYSMDAWLVPASSGDAYECLLTQGGGLGFFLSGTPRKLNLFSVSDHLATTGLTDGILTHLAATAGAGSGLVTFYKDGRPDGTGSLTVPAITFESISNDTASQTLGGDLVLQRVWDRVLSADEIAELYGG